MRYLVMFLVISSFFSLNFANAKSSTAVAADVPRHRAESVIVSNHAREAACALARFIPLGVEEIQVLCDTNNNITAKMSGEQVEAITAALLDALSQPHPDLSRDNAKRMIHLKYRIWVAKETFLLIF